MMQAKEELDMLSLPSSKTLTLPKRQSAYLQPHKKEAKVSLQVVELAMGYMLGLLGSCGHPIMPHVIASSMSPSPMGLELVRSLGPN